MKSLNTILLALGLLCCNAQAAGVNVAAGDVNGDGRPAPAASTDKQVQGNTTQSAVAIPSFMKNARKAKTAEDAGGARPMPGRIAAPGSAPQAGLLVPAVQKVREAAATSEPAAKPAGSMGYDIKRNQKP